MANTYDFPGATVDGQKITVEWLANDPRRIYRALNTLVQQRLIGDKVLTGRVDLTGSGSVIYETGEAIMVDDDPEEVSPLSEYPLVGAGTPDLSALKLSKRGLKTIVSDEMIAHNRIDKLMRDLRKIANKLVKYQDGTTLSAISSKVTQTQAAKGKWDGSETGKTPNPFVDVGLAGAQIDEQDKGYAADFVALTPTLFVYAISTAAVLDYMPRETANNIISTGNMAQIAGVTYLKTTNMPSGVQGLVGDSRMLGSQAFERLGGGYQGQAGGVETKRYRDDKADGVVVQARIVRSPMVIEPDAAVKLTGLK